MGDIRSIMFVCLGNICRSPLAEAVFMNVAKEKGVADKWFADSAGTGAWHKCQPPDNRTMDVLKKHGIHGYTHAAKQIVQEDFNRFDYIMGMDQYNIRDINFLKPNESKAKIYLFGSFSKKGTHNIPDPYHNVLMTSFEILYQKIRRICTTILEELK